MSKHLGIYLISGVVVASLLAYTVFNPVAVDEVHVVRQFGRTIAVQDGEAEAGLHLKLPWPIQSVRVYDRRLQVLPDVPTEVMTGDDKSLLVTMACAWRIQDAEAFANSPETMDEAEVILRRRLKAKVLGLVNRTPLSSLVNVDPDRVRLRELADQLRDELHDEVMAEFGIAVDMVRFKSLSVPQKVSMAVIQSISEERDAMAKSYRAQGEARATGIREQANKARDMILAFAERMAGEIRSKGELASAEYYRLMQQNPEFVEFLRKLEALEAYFQEGGILVFDSVSSKGLGVELLERMAGGEYETPDSEAKPETQAASDGRELTSQGEE